MPANLPPQYYELEREFRKERDDREKLRLAQELLRMMPKHKGTDKLQADMKAKIAKLKKSLEGGSKSAGTRQVNPHDHIDREGSGQIILIGPPNAGRSSLVDALTNAEPLIADYPFTTREPMSGMMTFETVQLQLIDTPPISEDQYENYLSNLIRNADLILLVCDLEDTDGGTKAATVVEQLHERRILLRPDDNLEVEDVRFKAKKTLLCAHKEYEDTDGENLMALRQQFPDYEIIPTSVLDDDSLTLLGQTLFRALNIIRVYTKHVGHDVKMEDPVVLPIGGTVLEAATAIHKDFGEKLKFAKIWGEGKFDGQRVKADYVLNDGDIVEFHI